MKRIEIYQLILRSVEDEVGIDYIVFKDRKYDAHVEARSLLVNTLFHFGFKESLIAHLTGLSQQCVNKLHNSFYNRKKQDALLRISYDRITTKLHQLLPEQTRA